MLLLLNYCTKRTFIFNVFVLKVEVIEITFVRPGLWPKSEKYEHKNCILTNMSFIRERCDLGLANNSCQTGYFLWSVAKKFLQDLATVTLANLLIVNRWVILWNTDRRTLHAHTSLNWTCLLPVWNKFRRQMLFHAWCYSNMWSTKVCNLHSLP